LKDLLRSFILEFGRKWKNHLQLVKFTYNNNYQAIIGMTPFEALYGRRCQTPLYWDEVGKQNLLRQKMV
jgi:hypothetical protein